MIVCRAIRNRKTGEIIGPVVPIRPEDIPYSYPKVDQVIWRYLDLWKFEKLIATRSLYFARADKFKDKLEGKFAPDYTAQPSPSDAAFYQAYNMAAGDPVAKEQSHETIKRCTFVSCWHMADEESQKMWDEYTESPESVVVRSTGNALLRFVEDRVEILKSCVKYQSNDVPRTELTHLSLFLFKPLDCEFEREFRMIRPMALDGTESVLSDDPADFGRNVPIRLGKIIKQVRTHPNASQKTKEIVDTLLKQHLSKVRRTNSSLE